MVNNTITRSQLDKWHKYSIGKPCPKHPDRTIKNGKYGLYCGAKTELGTWCSGGWPTEEWLEANKLTE